MGNTRDCRRRSVYLFWRDEIMVKNVGIYVRSVFWRTQAIDVSTPVYHIALYSPQHCLSPEDFGGHAILHCNIRCEVIQDVDTYRIDINDPEVVIYDANNLQKIQLPPMVRSVTEISRKLERYEILDIRN